MLVLLTQYQLRLLNILHMRVHWQSDRLIDLSLLLIQEGIPLNQFLCPMIPPSPLNFNGSHGLFKVVVGLEC